ncbi:MAG: hypothetical protein JNM34_03260 [Chthonomonadaceae bacterium]|nr:hypothetical protein [Chthonomonadaceae bacterium]
MLAALVCSAIVGSMEMARYSAKSDLPDTSAVGGFGESEHVSWGIDEVAVDTKDLTLIVKKNECCGSGAECPQILILANGTSENVWLPAFDSLLPIVRQAKDSSGTWRNIEYRLYPDCGNSYHRVALGAKRAFVWDVPTTSGPISTKSRYVVYLGKDEVFSNEFDCKVSAGAFNLPTEYKDYKLDSQGMIVRR